MPQTKSEEEKTLPSTPIKSLEPSWSNVPNKLQLAVLSCSRLVDFWQMASLQSYMVYQLRSFDPALPDSAISHQAGVLQGSFTAAQIVTSVLWGRAADSPSVGRKNVLLIGLVGTGISCLGVAFSGTFWQATVWRLLGGAINGTIGATRTMVAETVEKRWHSRAFLLLPLAFNVANILGPVVGGLLVDPVGTYPATFGRNSTFGGKDGVLWMRSFPYALPSILCALLLFLEAIVVVVFLHETLPTRHGIRGPGHHLKEMYDGIMSVLRNRHGRQQGYELLKREESSDRSSAGVKEALGEKAEDATHAPFLPFRMIWTSNVLWTLLSIAIFDFHMGAFAGLWIIFLSTRRAEERELSRRVVDAIHFTGGLSFQPPKIGLALAILGLAGLCLQIVLYPWANRRFGLMRCFRCSLFLFPIAYLLAPYISLLPSSTPPPLPASGIWIWLGILFVLVFQVIARTFALPASIILVNNSTPHPSVLGTIHGVGQSVSSALRTIGPIASGYWYGIGLRHDMVGMSWWIVGAVSGFGCVASFWVRNGSGHETTLPRNGKPQSEA
ncbi:MFS general substrate transporter [Lindgomyces ingoldianus]|uniref:MFS general substrate transporter n=1 Tax=Lindgomyces ingoldianus TaxID=673940 RepID=A0ACB6QIV8_9PLEO|nr:MFS general substrate transporter [Lindgomyces ingoldianus]KAF2466830.1 MFS general substrate transporter [Lindgomyces ingoldianus]